MPDAFTPLRGPRMGPDGRRIRKEGVDPWAGAATGPSPSPPSSQVCERGLRLPTSRRKRIPPKGQLCSRLPKARKPATPRSAPSNCSWARRAPHFMSVPGPLPRAPRSCSGQTPPPGPALAPPRVPSGTWALRRHLSFGQQQHPLLPVGGAQARGGQGHPFSLFHPEALCRALQDRQASQA